MIDKYLDEQVTVWTANTPDKFGEKTYNEGVQMDARFIDKIQVIKDVSGKEVTSYTTVYCKTDIQYDSYLERGTITGDSDPKSRLNAYKLIKIEQHRGLGNQSLNNETLFKVFL